MDITNIVNHLESRTGKPSAAPLAGRVARQADTNRDGNVSSVEFREFLSKLTAMIESGTTSAETAPQTPVPASVTPPAPRASAMPAATKDALRALAAALEKVR